MVLPDEFEAFLKTLSNRELVAMLGDAGRVDDQETLGAVRTELAGRAPKIQVTQNGD